MSLWIKNNYNLPYIRVSMFWRETFSVIMSRKQEIQMTTSIQGSRPEKIAMSTSVTFTGESGFKVAFIMPSVYTRETPAAAKKQPDSLQLAPCSCTGCHLVSRVLPAIFNPGK
jgi:hypothetical protein